LPADSHSLSPPPRRSCLSLISLSADLSSYKLLQQSLGTEAWCESQSADLRPASWSSDLRPDLAPLTSVPALLLWLPLRALKLGASLRPLTFAPLAGVLTSAPALLLWPPIRAWCES
jgi:hypothetical protein